MAKKEEAYFKRFPDKDYDDFLRTLPPYPPDYPREDDPETPAGDSTEESTG
jgi:hypothetical protein